MLQSTYRLLRPLLFALDAEVAHERLLGALATVPHLAAMAASFGAGPPPAALAREVAGLRFGGPVGLAAGLDKDGVAIPVWEALGFGSIEVGTVTARPQPGNPKPRLFRLQQDRALINRMGFNNRGSEALAARLRALREHGGWPKVPVGVNVGINKDTSADQAVADYVLSVERLAALVDYLTVNVSSPNTPGLRELQSVQWLERLLPAVLEAARAGEGTDARCGRGAPPVFLKLAPDLADPALAAAVDLAARAGIAGVIATNTTITRPLASEVGEYGLTHDPGEPGGLSGRPLWPLARRKIATVLEAADGRLPVIGVGGIATAEQVEELLAAGCAAVQLYTAFIFEGPGLPARLHRELARRVER